ncbi:hypothetical protein Dimus_037827 [Dionaea muscipula]
MTTPAEKRMLERTPEDLELAAMYDNIGRAAVIMSDFNPRHLATVKAFNDVKWKAAGLEDKIAKAESSARTAEAKAEEEKKEKEEKEKLLAKANEEKDKLNEKVAELEAQLAEARLAREQLEKEREQEREQSQKEAAAREEELETIKSSKGILEGEVTKLIKEIGTAQQSLSAEKLRADAAVDSLRQRRRTLAELLPKQLDYAKKIAIHEFINSRGFLTAAIPLCIPHFTNGFNLCKAQAAQLVAENKDLAAAMLRLKPVGSTKFEQVPEGKQVAPPLEAWNDSEGPSDPLSILLEWSYSEATAAGTSKDAATSQQ